MSPDWKPTYELSETKQVSLPGRDATTVWDSGAPKRSFTFGAATDKALSEEAPPPVLLLHGWNIDAPTNYGYAFPKLAASQRTVMYDQQGHGDGPRHDAPFTLTDAARDAVTVLDALEIDAAIIVGYSLGGAVAQTFAHEHPDRCAGLVLSATAGVFSETARERAEFGVLARTARLLRKVPTGARSKLFEVILGATTRKYPPWIADVVRKGDPINLLEAGASLGGFDSTSWTESKVFPSSFVVTATDTIVPMRRQVELATALKVDSMHSVPVGHEVPILNHDDYNTALTEAVRTVTGLVEQRS